MQRGHALQPGRRTRDGRAVRSVVECTDTAGWALSGGSYNAHRLIFCFSQSIKIPFDFKAILKDDETEILEEDFLHLSA